MKNVITTGPAGRRKVKASGSPASLLRRSHAARCGGHPGPLPPQRWPRLRRQEDRRGKDPQASAARPQAAHQRGHLHPPPGRRPPGRGPADAKRAGTATGNDSITSAAGSHPPPPALRASHSRACHYLRSPRLRLETPLLPPAGKRDHSRRRLPSRGPARASHQRSLLDFETKRCSIWTEARAGRGRCRRTCGPHIAASALAHSDARARAAPATSHQSSATPHVLVGSLLAGADFRVAPERLNLRALVPLRRARNQQPSGHSAGDRW
jgi:hypothetical protein